MSIITLLVILKLLEPNFQSISQVIAMAPDVHLYEVPDKP